MLPAPVNTEHHTVFQEMAATLGSALSGGVAFRYGQIFVKDMPVPLSGERIYAYFYNVLQDIINNSDAKVHFGGKNLPGEGQKGGDPK